MTTIVTHAGLSGLSHPYLHELVSLLGLRLVLFGGIFLAALFLTTALFEIRSVMGQIGARIFDSMILLTRLNFMCQLN